MITNGDVLQLPIIVLKILRKKNEFYIRGPGLWNFSMDG